MFNVNQIIDILNNNGSISFSIDDEDDLLKITDIIDSINPKSKLYEILSNYLKTEDSQLLIIYKDINAGTFGIAKDNNDGSITIIGSFITENRNIIKENILNITVETEKNKASDSPYKNIPYNDFLKMCNESF